MCEAPGGEYGIGSLRAASSSSLLSWILDCSCMAVCVYVLLLIRGISCRHVIKAQFINDNREAGTSD